MDSAFSGGTGGTAELVALRLLRATAAAISAAVGGTAALVALAWLEGLQARGRLVPLEPLAVVPASGRFGDGLAGVPLELVLLGDSLAVGVGAARPEDTVGVALARGLAREAGRPVQLSNVAAVGSESRDLTAQLQVLQGQVPRPDVAVIIVGGNDVMHLQRIGDSARHLSETVRELRRRGAQVVVATCPDMGTVRPFFQPLRFLAHWMSRVLATTQTIVVLRNGGRTVSLADTLGPIFRQDPKLMFSADNLHPSSAGYAHAVEVLLPSVCAAAGCRTERDLTVPHRVYRKGRRYPLAWFAFRASRRAGSEVSAVKVRHTHFISLGRRRLGHWREQMPALPRLPHREANGHLRA